MNTMLLIAIAVIILIIIDKKESFIGSFSPFSINKVNNPNNYIDRSYYINGGLYAPYFKLGETNIDNTPNREYDMYLKKLHNKHLSRKILKINTQCSSCQIR